MKIISLSNFFHRFNQTERNLLRSSDKQALIHPPGLARLSRWPVKNLPRFVQHSEVAMKYFHLLTPLDWDNLQWRDRQRPFPGPTPRPPHPFVAAFLVKIDQKQVSIGQLRQYLVEHPALTWLLGFPLQMDIDAPHGFNVAASLPSAARFSNVLRALPNQTLQDLLSDSVRLLRCSLPDNLPFGKEISLDTKHILAWVKQNNAKAYIKEGRFDKYQQPAGDPDCKLGCKRRRNRPPNLTPTKEGQPVDKLGVGKGEFYWGYASGVVATKVPAWGEFVLAELTQTFNHSDISYFFPLMTAAENRLGFCPPFGTMDAAFDAFYTYEYFHHASGFAAIPYVDRSKGNHFQFDADGLPLCPANLPMPVKSTFINRSSTVVHQRARHACPLLFPVKLADACPINHKHWHNGGCKSTLPTSIGVRIRYQLDRQSPAYKQLYKQRTAVERIFSQAVAFGIERPKLRNQQAITNQNTLIYVLINLRALHRIRAIQAAAK